MSDIDFPHLWFVQGRNGRRYAFYRRKRRAIPLKVPASECLSGLLKGYQGAHASFEAKQSNQRERAFSVWEETDIERFRKRWPRLADKFWNQERIRSVFDPSILSVNDGGVGGSSRLSATDVLAALSRRLPDLRIQEDESKK